MSLSLSFIPGLFDPGPASTVCGTGALSVGFELLIVDDGSGSNSISVSDSISRVTGGSSGSSVTAGSVVSGVSGVCDSSCGVIGYKNNITKTTILNHNSSNSVLDLSTHKNWVMINLASIVKSNLTCSKFFLCATPDLFMLIS